MCAHRKMLRVTPREKLCFLFGLSKEEIKESSEDYDSSDLENIREPSGLEAEDLRSLLKNPTALEDRRLNPNRITESQIREIPQLINEKREVVLKGRPYYSMDELMEATAVPRTILEELFEIQDLEFRDKKTGINISFVPVSGRYIVPNKGEFEEADPVPDSGFTEVFVSKIFKFRVIEHGSEFEGEGRRPHDLKKSLEGRVYPVLRDNDGFERYFVPGSLDLWFKPGTPEVQCLQIIKRHKLTVTYKAKQINYYRAALKATPVDYDLTREVLSTINRIQEIEEVDFAEPDQVGFEDFGPDFSEVAEENDFEEADRFWNRDVIDLDRAHSITEGSDKVTVFIIDSGCRTDHEDLQPVFRSDWKTLDLNFDINVPESKKSPHEEIISHGTKVAGVIQQVAPKCRILPVKIPGQPSSQAYGLRAAAIRQALNILKPGERGVLNLSWRTNGDIIGIREALVEADSKGVAIVTSAGNYRRGDMQVPDKTHYPSDYMRRYPYLKSLCSVAAVSVGDHRASYSYYGKHSVTVAAPGGDHNGLGSGIYTTSTPETHAYVAGTSFAAPHVAGLIALLFSKNMDLSAEEARKTIKATADPITNQVNPATPVGMRNQNGVETVSLRINARAALEADNSNGSLPGTYTITARASEGGVISPDGTVFVDRGTSQEFTIVPDFGKRVRIVQIDGISVGPVTSYIFHNVTALHTVEAKFEEEIISEDDRMNINRATLDELIALPFIGPWIAQRIVEHREAHGPFNSIWGLGRAGMSFWAIRQLERFIIV